MSIATRLLFLVLLVSSLALPAVAQGDRFERKVAFQVDKSDRLDAQIGPVQVTTVKVTNLGRGYGRGGISLRSASPPSELSTTLRVEFDTNNPRDEEWEITYTVEFLDKDGTIVDRGSKKETYEGEGKTFRLEHPLIEYALPLITDIRITLQGRRT